jgi:hypothetical protein
VHVQVEMPNGMSAEIQLVPKEVAAVQESAHHFYDQFKRVTNPTAEQMAAIKSAQEAGNKMLDEAWKTAEARGFMQPQAAGAGNGHVAKIAARDNGKGAGVYVNFARISSPDDVKQVIADTAEAFKGEIDEARRGAQSNEQTAALAERLGMSVEDLLARQKGQPFNAEQSLAARQLLNASAARLLEMSKVVASPNAGPADAFNFRRMLATHQAIQSEVIAARTETARALQSWSMPAGGNVEAARQVQQFLDASGGIQTTQELARRMNALAAQGASPGAMTSFVQKGWGAITMDGVREAYVMGMLWNPTTHMVNTASNLAVAFQQIYERGVAARIGDFLGSSIDARVVDGEATAMAYGLITGLKDAFRLAGKAIRTGDTGSVVHTIDMPQNRISVEAISEARGYDAAATAAFKDSGIGKAVDFIGFATNIPGRLLGSQDEFFKSIGYRMEVHAQSLRQATAEGLDGVARMKRMQELVNNPPEHIKIAAADAALYNTFQTKMGWIGDIVNYARSRGGSINPLYTIIPFVRTPTNILRYTFERSPMAPFVGQWRADIAAGGARQALALSRMATGTSILAVSFDMAGSGMLTGSGPKRPEQRQALERQGWQANSFYDGEKYISFNRTDPFAMALAFAGSVSEIMRSSELAPEDFDDLTELSAAAATIISRSVTEKTYFSGVSRAIDAMQSWDTGGGGDWLRQQVGSHVPFNSALGVAERAIDPTQREVMTAWDAVMSRVAGMSDKLTPARDLWGEEKKGPEVYGRLFDVLSPAKATEKINAPIDEEMSRLGIGKAQIRKSETFDGVPVNFRDFPEIYDEYVRLAGNELVHPVYGYGARDFLDRVVTGKHFMSQAYEIMSDGPDGGKAAFISNMIDQYRQAARDQIMEKAETKWPEFFTLIRDGKAEKEALKMPNISGTRGPSRSLAPGAQPSLQ